LLEVRAKVQSTKNSGELHAPSADIKGRPEPGHIALLKLEDENEASELGFLI